MIEYRARIGPSSTQTHSTPLIAKRFGLGELAQRYGVADMMDFSQSDNRHTDQTVDEEFLAYTTATFVPTEVGDAQILAFWEVSHYYLPCSLPES